jgi:threonine/homoserine/homoserine lactone efflux protein
MLLSALTGCALGFLGSVPVAGPISVLVLALGVENKSRTAAWVAVGGAAAEAFYAFLAFWGFSRYLARMPLLMEASRGITGLILLFVGLSLIRQNNRNGSVQAPALKQRPGNGFVLGFTISILNPTLILTWAAASGLLFSSHLLSSRHAEAFPFSLGVCGGIILWFSLLLRIVARTRGRFHPERLNRVMFWMGCTVLLGAAFFLLPFLCQTVLGLRPG